MIHNDITKLAQILFEMDTELDSVGYYLDCVSKKYMSLIIPKFLELCHTIQAKQKLGDAECYGDIDFSITVLENIIYIENHFGKFNYKISFGKALIEIERIYLATHITIASIVKGYNECDCIDCSILEIKTVMSMLSCAVHTLASYEV